LRTLRQQQQQRQQQREHEREHEREQQWEQQRQLHEQRQQQRRLRDVRSDLHDVGELLQWRPLHHPARTDAGTLLLANPVMFSL
jgi:hypothetical protein